MILATMVEDVNTIVEDGGVVAGTGTPGTLPETHRPTIRHDPR